MELNYHAIFQAASAFHDEGDHRKAFAELRKLLEYPGELNAEDSWKDVWHLFGSIAGAMGFEKLSHLAIKAGDQPHNAQLLYSLGYELIEVHLPLIAATPLNQAHLMLPDNEAILSELSTAFENAGLYDLAYMHLSCAKDVLKESFMCRYLLAFNGIMSGHLAEGREIYQTLAAPPDENFAFMRERIGNFLDRADKLTNVSDLGSHDLRGWHFVLTGGLLLHLSQYGFDEPMRGRYCYLQDTYSLVREGIERVRASLHTWGVRTLTVVFFPDRNSEVLARAFAELEGANLTQWFDGHEAPQGPTLYLAYDLGQTSSEFIRECLDRKPDQFLWGHALNWVEDFPITPDFTTFMYQFNIAPWEGGGAAIDPETQEQTITEDDPAPVADLARKVLEAEINDNPVDEMEDFLSFIHAVGLPSVNCRREKYFQGSPVKSNRMN